MIMDVIDQRALHWLAATADGTFEWISSVCAWHSLDFHNAPVLDNAMTALYHMGERQSCDDTAACGTFRVRPNGKESARGDASQIRKNTAENNLHAEPPRRFEKRTLLIQS